MKTILQFVMSLSIIVHMVFAWLMVDSFFNGRLTTADNASLWTVRIMVWLIIAGPVALVLKELIYSDRKPTP